MGAERPELESLAVSEVVGTAVGVDGTLVVVLQNGRVFAGIPAEDRKNFVRERIPELSDDEIEEVTDHFWSEVPPVPGTEAGFKRS